jgi:ABC-type transport system substrate-binding protein
MNHELDIIHDVSPEGMFTLANEAPSSIAWFPAFPYAHPDPTLPAVLLNHHLEKFQDRDVRWALALAIDTRAVAMASFRGARRSRLSRYRRPVPIRSTTTNRLRSSWASSRSTPASR